MTPVETLILVLYFFVLSILAIYGWHRYWLVFLYMKHRDRGPWPAPEIADPPLVTIQLPIYNEMYIAELAVRRHAARGFDITYLHRVDRRGYKAGALEAGLKASRGQFIAIFDADFVPPKDFLRRTLPHFY